MPFFHHISRVISLLPLLTLLCAQDPKNLPRVLIAGDGFYQQSYKSIATELSTQAQITCKHPGSTGAALAAMNEWLGPEKWDVIFFNFGHADLVHRDPQTKSVRVMSRHAGGVRMTSPDQYEKNLLEIVKRLKSTGATLIWASTTPLPNSDQLYLPASEVEYNQIAARVMEREKSRNSMPTRSPKWSWKAGKSAANPATRIPWCHPSLPPSGSNFCRANNVGFFLRIVGGRCHTLCWTLSSLTQHHSPTTFIL